jgi:hypothetical protein
VRSSNIRVVKAIRPAIPAASSKPDIAGLCRCRLDASLPWRGGRASISAGGSRLAGRCKSRRRVAVAK